MRASLVHICGCYRTQHAWTPARHRKSPEEEEGPATVGAGGRLKPEENAVSESPLRRWVVGKPGKRDFEAVFSFPPL